MSKELLVVVMSVGEFSRNGTAKYLLKIGGEKNSVIVLPSASEEYENSYIKKGFRVFIYDEKKYQSKDRIEFFGFRPRNCGGIGRQGIAEAVDEYSGEDNKYVILELDDDTSGIHVRKYYDGKWHSRSIKTFEQLEKLVNAEDDFYNKTGIELSLSTGATIPDEFISNHKIFNNFIMRKGNELNYFGFSALCSDDYRYNIYRNLLDCTPMISTSLGSITFTQSQGNRSDGNAPLYNSDYSWKKSYGLKMIAPSCTEQRIVKEQKRVLFRENIKPSLFYPPISVTDKNKEIVGEWR